MRNIQIIQKIITRRFLSFWKGGKMIKVDAIGDACPIPVIKVKNAMASAAGEEVEVYVDNETAAKNVTKYAAGVGGVVTSSRVGEQTIRLFIRTSNSGMDVKPENEEDEEKEKNDIEKGYVVSVSSDKMGRGDDGLGDILMKSFFFALTKQEKLPEKILFYNGGALLTTEGSKCLEDIKWLEEEGVEIYTCGTCLDHYKKTEFLKVGEVTNMYSIVEMLAGATKTVRP